jgi:outer membrane protein OmpA-like peptidoglycan-associated protein
MALALGAGAQQGGHSNYVGLNLGGGMNTMTFSPANGTRSAGLGLDCGLHYAHFFNGHWGIGAGIHYSTANAYALYDFTEVTPNLVHASNPGVHYNLTTTFDGWKERQSVGILGIPVEALYRTALNEKWSFLGGLGLQLDLPLSGKYSASKGQYSTTGDFPALGGYTVSEMPEHGFSTYDAAFDAKIDNLSKTAVSLLADAGAHVDLTGNWGLYLGLYCTLGLTDMLGEQRDNNLLTINTTDPKKLDYYGTYGSNEISSLHLLRLGVKVGVDLGWSREPKAPAEPQPDLEAEARAQAQRDSIEAARVKEAKEAEQARLRAEAEAARLEREKAEAEARAKAEAAKPKTEAEIKKAEQKTREHAAFLAGYHDVAYFEPGNDTPIWSQLNADSWDNLKELMEQYPDVMVTISGHTDNTGKPATNQDISERRAENIKALLVEKGIPAKRIKAVGKGQYEPIADNKTPEGRAKNRRVEIDIYRQKK